MTSPTRPRLDTGADDQPDHQGSTSDSAWLRHDLPDPSAAGANGAGAAGRAPDSGLARARGRGGPADAVPRSPHDTGVPPTIVLEAEDSTPSHVTGLTQPMPDDVAHAADTSATSDASVASDAAQRQPRFRTA